MTWNPVAISSETFYLINGTIYKLRCTMGLFIKTFFYESETKTKTKQRQKRLRFKRDKSTMEGGVALFRWFGSLEMVWLFGDGLAHWRWFGSL